ncbi:MAG: hypothetical protein KC449_12305 [Anaerolineales bacterium]|nr:hypothetical protein [Anaerolineales bacterium]
MRIKTSSWAIPALLIIGLVLAACSQEEAAPTAVPTQPSVEVTVTAEELEAQEADEAMITEADAVEEGVVVTKPLAELVDEWVIAREELFIPVVNTFGLYLQSAREYFMANNMDMAVEEIRGAAELLKSEVNTGSDADIAARETAADTLNSLAEDIESGADVSIEHLDAVFAQAYQADVEHGSLLTSAEDIVLLTAHPMYHFEQASLNLSQGDAITAASRIRKGVAFLRLQAAHATGQDKETLDAAIADLEQIANDLNAGTDVPQSLLDRAIAHTQYVLSRHYYESLLNLDSTTAAVELQQAIDFLNQEASTARDPEKLQTAVAQLQTLADKLNNGEDVTSTELDSAFAQTHYALALNYYDKAIENLSNEEQSQTAYDLEGAAYHLEMGLVWNGQSPSDDMVTLIGEIHTVAADIISGSNVTPDQNALDALGQQIQQLGEAVTGNQ